MISLRHIYKQYGTHRVLEDVNLTIREGEIYGLVGKNGAGKTTIFKIILGLTEYEKGRLSIAGSKTNDSRFSVMETESRKEKINNFLYFSVRPSPVWGEPHCLDAALSRISPTKLEKCLTSCAFWRFTFLTLPIKILPMSRFSTASSSSFMATWR